MYFDHPPIAQFFQVPVDGAAYTSLTSHGSASIRMIGPPPVNGIRARQTAGRPPDGVGYGLARDRAFWTRETAARPASEMIPGVTRLPGHGGGRPTGRPAVCSVVRGDRQPAEEAPIRLLAIMVVVLLAGRVSGRAEDGFQEWPEAHAAILSALP